MTRGTRLLLVSAVGAWGGAAAGALAPDASGPFALAAGLAALLGARGGARRPAWLVGAIVLAYAALASPGAAPPPFAGRLRARVVSFEETASGFRLELRAPGRGTFALRAPATGDAACDAPPDGFGPGALIDLPLEEDRRAPLGARAAALSTIRVVERPTALDRLLAAPSGLRRAFQRRARGALVRGADDDVGGLLFATVAGVGDAIPDDAWRAMRAAGLAHIAVVSGFNVGMAALVVGALAAPLGGSGHPRRRAAALAAVALLLLLLPADPPVRRAAFAVLLARGGALFGRGAPPAAALALAALILLALDPTLAASLSFALTVAATASIVLVAGLPRRVVAALAFAAPTFATWPILVLATGRAGPWTIPANILAAPAVLPQLAAGWVAVLAPAGPLAAAALAVGRGASRWILLVSREVALWPGSGRIAAPCGVVWGAFALAVLFGAILAAPRRAKFAAALAPLVLALWAWPLRWLAFPPPAPPPGLVVFDVGQGSAALLSDGRSAVLLDAADDRRRDGTRALLRALRERGVPRIDYLVVSHADRDHSGGGAEILAALDVGAVAVPPAALDDPALASLRAEAAARGVPLETVEEGWRAVGRDAELRALFPPRGRRDDPNRAGIVLLARIGSLVALLPGDADADVEGELVLAKRIPRLDVLVAGHHGARGCTTRALLRRAQPQAALISRGLDNAYGHPHRETLARLAAARVARFDTALDGSLAASCPGETRLVVTAERGGSWRVRRRRGVRELRRSARGRSRGRESRGRPPPESSGSFRAARRLRARRGGCGRRAARSPPRSPSPKTRGGAGRARRRARRGTPRTSARSSAASAARRRRRCARRRAAPRGSGSSRSRAGRATPRGTPDARRARSRRRRGAADVPADRRAANRRRPTRRTARAPARRAARAECRAPSAARRRRSRPAGRRRRCRRARGGSGSAT